MKLFLLIPIILSTSLNLISVNGFHLTDNTFNLIQPLENSVQNVFSNFEKLFSLTSDNHSIEFIKVQQFLNEIEFFEENKSNVNEFIHLLNENNIKHYSQDIDNLPISLSQYESQYVLRLSDWNEFNELENELEKENKSSFFEVALLTIKQLNIPIWEKSRSHKFIDIQVSKDQGKSILSLLSMMYSNENDFKSKIIILDLPQKIFETFPESEINYDINNDDISTNVEIFFKNYRDIDSIYSWFDLLVSTYPDILNIEYIGNTFEGRPMKALRLSVHGDSKTDKIKTVVITSGIHAREWISVSTSCYILFQLLSDYENGNVNIKRYLENLDFLFLPVMNPDGYAFTWKTERLWRKNKQRTFNPRCLGIDIDHSFDFHFTTGIESPCSDDYSGEAAFEALESYNWDNYLNGTKHSHPIYAYIDLHSYAEEVLYPYAYSCDILPRDEENLLELGYGLAQAIRLKSGKYYQILKACQDKGADLLPSMGSGSALDYMYHNKAYWAFVLKLRDSGTHGFLLPSKYIVPVGKEIYASVKYFAAFLLSDK
jgi:extracellular matrix protein 14